MRSFSVTPDKEDDLSKIICSPAFTAWIGGKVGLHRPQSNYAPVSYRLTPATIVGLAVQYWRLGLATEISGEAPRRPAPTRSARATPST